MQGEQNYEIQELGITGGTSQRKFKNYEEFKYIQVLEMGQRRWRGWTGAANKCCFGEWEFQVSSVRLGGLSGGELNADCPSVVGSSCRAGERERPGLCGRVPVPGEEQVIS